MIENAVIVKHTVVFQTMMTNNILHYQVKQASVIFSVGKMFEQQESKPLQPKGHKAELRRIQNCNIKKKKTGKKLNSKGHNHNLLKTSDIVCNYKSLSCCAINKDIPDPLLPPLPIVHCSR